MPPHSPFPATAALLVIDLQKAIDAPYWGPRNNPLPGETIVTKRVNSAFIGTDLEARLKRRATLR